MSRSQWVAAKAEQTKASAFDNYYRADVDGHSLKTPHSDNGRVLVHGGNWKVDGTHLDELERRPNETDVVQEFIYAPS